MKQVSPVHQFAERLAQERREKAARERRDIQKQDVAAAIGVSSSTYGRYESALTMPDDATMYRLAAYFGVTPAWLRYGQPPREYPGQGAPESILPDPALDRVLTPAEEQRALRRAEELAAEREAARPGAKKSRRKRA